MAQFECTITIARPKDEVFEHVVELENSRYFDPAVESVRRLTPGELGAGTRYEFREPIPPGVESGRRTRPTPRSSPTSGPRSTSRSARCVATGCSPSSEWPGHARHPQRLPASTPPDAGPCARAGAAGATHLGRASAVHQGLDRGRCPRDHRGRRGRARSDGDDPLRRHCRRGPLRRLAHRDAAGRQGHHVLLVDRARFPSDTVSTHLIHPPGVSALDRWGLLDRLVATGCPPISTYSFDFGPVTITGAPRPADTIAVAYCPRRTVLDKLLVDAAAEAGAEVREGFTVDELIIEDGAVMGIRGRAGGGRSVVARALVVVGADGAHSRVADAVQAEHYHDKPAFAVAYYSYWSGFPVEDARWAVRPSRGFGAFPTNDGLTMLIAAWPYAEMASVKQDIEANYLQALQQAFGDRVTEAHREERIIGAATHNTSTAHTVPAGCLSATPAI